MMEDLDLVSRRSLDRRFKLEISSAVSNALNADYSGDRHKSAEWERKAEALKRAVEILNEEPSAYEIIRIGEWVKIPKKMYLVRCSICGNRVGIETPFCSSCGAKMKSSQTGKMLQSAKRGGQ